MKISKVIDSGNDKLLLFFSGWSVAPSLFHDYGVESNTDYWIAYDYRNLTFVDLSQYSRIDVVAWSLGVWVASQVLSDELPIYNAVAVNGTLKPIDDAWGIPEKIFDGTLNGLSEAGRKKFNLRMCGQKALFERYEKATVQRPLEEIREELAVLQKTIHATFTINWDGWTKVVIASDDRIFPTKAQLDYWKEHPNVITVEGAHFPFCNKKSWAEWME